MSRSTRTRRLPNRLGDYKEAESSGASGSSSDEESSDASASEESFSDGSDYESAKKAKKKPARRKQKKQSQAKGGLSAYFSREGGCDPNAVLNCSAKKKKKPSRRKRTVSSSEEEESEVEEEEEKENARPRRNSRGSRSSLRKRGAVSYKENGKNDSEEQESSEEEEEEESDESVEEEEEEESDDEEESEEEEARQPKRSRSRAKKPTRASVRRKAAASAKPKRAAPKVRKAPTRSSGRATKAKVSYTEKEVESCSDDYVTSESEEEESESEDDNEEEEEDSDPNFDECILCQEGGNLLCCDNCPRAFHEKCVLQSGGTLEDGPRGMWTCRQAGYDCNEEVGPRVDKFLGWKPHGETQEILVKWKSESYMHCKWMKRKELEQKMRLQDRHKLKRFIRDEPDVEEMGMVEKDTGITGEGIIMGAYLQIDRILGERKITAVAAEVDAPAEMEVCASGDGTEKSSEEQEVAGNSKASGEEQGDDEKELKESIYLVKWRNQTYLSATWEKASVFSHQSKSASDTKELEAKLQKFRARRNQDGEFAGRQTVAERLMGKGANKPSKKKRAEKAGGAEDNEDEEMQTAKGEGGVEAKKDGGAAEKEAHSDLIASSDALRFSCDFSLRDYQLEGSRWMAFNYSQNRNSLLGDEMGLGKTIQSISLLQYLKVEKGIRGPFLVVAPLSTLPHWKKEFETWTQMHTVVYHGSQLERERIAELEFALPEPEVGAEGSSRRKKSRGKHSGIEALLTSYEIVTKDEAVLSKVRWEALIVDEAHRLKNEQAKLYESLYESYIFKHKLLLTGTPIQNNVAELWALLRFLGARGLGDKDPFMEKYSGKNTKAIAALQKLIAPFFLRRMKEDVATDIPAREETLVEVELTVPQKQYYKAVYERNTAFLSSGGKRGQAVSLMNIAMQLRKCCNHPYLLKDVEKRHLADLMSKKKQAEDAAATGLEAVGGAAKPDLSKEEKRSQKISFEMQALVQSSGKMVLLDKLLPKLRREGHKVLIFSQFLNMLDIIEDYARFKGYPLERLDGSTNATQRAAAMARFQRGMKKGGSKSSAEKEGGEVVVDKHRFLFLLSTKAGGLGITLTAADTVIIFDSDWNPQNDVQAQARCHRIGQTKSVSVYRLVTAGTYEQQMLHASSMKLGLENAILDSNLAKDGKQKPGKLSNAEVERMLKHGAFNVFGDGEDSNARSSKFCESDIDSILAHSSSKVTFDQDSARAGGSFSKAKFVANAGNTVDMDDPKFWEKMGLKEQKEEELTRRSRKQVRRLGMVGEDEDGLSDDEESDSDEFMEGQESEEGAQQKGAKGRKRKKKSDWNFHVVLAKGLRSYGWGRWATLRRHIAGSHAEATVAAEAKGREAPAGLEGAALQNEALQLASVQLLKLCYLADGFAFPKRTVAKTTPGEHVGKENASEGNGSKPGAAATTAQATEQVKETEASGQESKPEGEVATAREQVVASESKEESSGVLALQDETPRGFAKRHGISVKELLALNREAHPSLKNDTYLAAETKLLLPKMDPATEGAASAKEGGSKKKGSRRKKKAVANSENRAGFQFSRSPDFQLAIRMAHSKQANDAATSVGAMSLLTRVKVGEAMLQNIALSRLVGIQGRGVLGQMDRLHVLQDMVLLKREAAAKDPQPLATESAAPVPPSSTVEEKETTSGDAEKPSTGEHKNEESPAAGKQEKEEKPGQAMGVAPPAGVHAKEVPRAAEEPAWAPDAERWIGDLKLRFSPDAGKSKAAKLTPWWESGHDRLLLLAAYAFGTDDHAAICAALGAEADRDEDREPELRRLKWSEGGGAQVEVGPFGTGELLKERKDGIAEIRMRNFTLFTQVKNAKRTRKWPAAAKMMARVRSLLVGAQRASKKAKKAANKRPSKKRVSAKKKKTPAAFARSGKKDVKKAGKDAKASSSSKKDATKAGKGPKAPSSGQKDATKAGKDVKASSSGVVSVKGGGGTSTSSATLGKKKNAFAMMKAGSAKKKKKKGKKRKSTLKLAPAEGRESSDEGAFQSNDPASSGTSGAPSAAKKLKKSPEAKANKSAKKNSVRKSLKKRKSIDCAPQEAAAEVLDVDDGLPLVERWRERHKTLAKKYATLRGQEKAAVSFSLVDVAANRALMLSVFREFEGLSQSVASLKLRMKANLQDPVTRQKNRKAKKRILEGVETLCEQANNRRDSLRSAMLRRHGKDALGNTKPAKKAKKMKASPAPVKNKTSSSSSKKMKRKSLSGASPFAPKDDNSAGPASAPAPAKKPKTIDSATLEKDFCAGVEKENTATAAAGNTGGSKTVLGSHA